MTLWDGLFSGTDRIVVLGATNRPNDIDSAILRRMPKRFPVGLLDVEQRLKILTLMLGDTELAPDFPLHALTEQTNGLSESDLKELCRNAVMLLVREYVRKTGDNKEAMEKGQLEEFMLQLIVLPFTAYPFYRAWNGKPPSFHIISANRETQSCERSLSACITGYVSVMRTPDYLYENYSPISS